LDVHVGAHRSCAKKQAGISFLLIDMQSPGLTVQPIITIDGHHEVNTIFLDNVRVPVANRVHEENRGWDIAKFLLGNERTGIARIGMSKYLLRRALRIAAEVPIGGGTLADDPGFRRRAVEIEVELRALEVTQMRVLAAMREHSDEPDPRSSILKVKGVELRQAASELLLRAAGRLRFQPRRIRSARSGVSACRDGMSSTVAPVYFILRAASIYGGSTEVQKNILARAVLGLPSEAGVDFNLSEEQVLLKDAIDKLILKEYSFEQRHRYGVTPKAGAVLFGEIGTAKLPGAAVCGGARRTRRWSAGADAGNGSSGSWSRAGTVLRQRGRRGKHSAPRSQ